MKIRSQLTALALAVLLPMAVLVAVTTQRLVELQRQAQHDRFLERVSAIRLALDTEIGASIRVLLALSESADFDATDVRPHYLLRFERLLANNPMWAGIALRREDGSSVHRRREAVAAAALDLDAVTLDQLKRTGVPVVSNAVPVDGGLMTFVAVPMKRISGRMDVLYIAIGWQDWLAFLRGYPVATRGTLTLSDGSATIIARTLHPEQSVGKKSGEVFWKQTIGKNEGSFVAPGIEGQSFYAAFSRLRTAQWVLGTGVPREDVEAALTGPTFGVLAGVLAACLVASLGAVFLGKQIAGAMTDLADAARAIAARRPPDQRRRLSVDEAETVRLTLFEAAERLTAREADLTQALRREEAAHAEAESASRGKDELLAMLGHELRNPLSAMKSAVKLLSMGGVKPDVEARAKAIVERQIGHLTRIVDDMLDVSRLHTSKAVLDRRSVDLARVVENVVESFNESGRCKHLRIQTAYTPAPVMGDETRLEQIVSNLLDNACKYTPPGGDLSVSVTTTATHAVVRVQDTGCGITPELLPHLFSVFAQGPRTIDRSQGGLGLGLAVVRRLVELHGGTVQAASDGIDRGAVLTFSLPLITSADALPSAGSSSPPVAVEWGRLQIVVVEDNVDSLEAIVGLLERRGHGVRPASDGAAGLQAIVEGGADVALIDVGLPGIDGMTVAARVRAAGLARTPVLVALTGYGSADDRARAMASGFDVFMVKPFDVVAFEAAVWQARKRQAS